MDVKTYIEISLPQGFNLLPGFVVGIDLSASSECSVIGSNGGVTFCTGGVATFSFGAISSVNFLISPLAIFKTPEESSPACFAPSLFSFSSRS